MQQEGGVRSAGRRVQVGLPNLLIRTFEYSSFTALPFEFVERKAS